MRKKEQIKETNFVLPLITALLICGFFIGFSYYFIFYIPMQKDECYKEYAEEYCKSIDMDLSNYFYSKFVPSPEFFCHKITKDRERSLSHFYFKIEEIERCS